MNFKILAKAKPIFDANVWIKIALPGDKIKIGIDNHWAFPLRDEIDV